MSNVEIPELIVNLFLSIEIFYRKIIKAFFKNVFLNYIKEIKKDNYLDIHVSRFIWYTKKMGSGLALLHFPSRVFGIIFLPSP